MLVPLLRLLTAGAALLAADAQPTVSFPGGASITGSLEVKPAGNPVCVFRGIPYAEPPIGDKRWKPSTLKPVTGSRLATTYGSTCIGTDTAPDATEDCLFLNVFTPANATATSKLPVMVWVHGGALLNGASNGFESQSLVKAGDQRVIVVTINYRLGVFGFFSSKELLAEGNGANFGLRDQEVAFQWIQKYIAYFGGDADNITAFGGSAGAWSLSTLMLARDGNQKLFHRAILMSGAFATVHDTPPPNVQQAKATTIATRVGCNGVANVVACLRKVDAKTLSALRDPSWRGFTWMPTVDGTFLLDTPIRRIRAGKISRIPTIVGTATDEGWYFTSWVTQESQFDSFLRAQFSMLTDAEYAKIVALYPASSFATLRHRTGEIYGDAMFVCPTEDFQLALAARGPSYRYRFNFPANVNGYMLTLHGSDGRYLFNQPGDIADSDVPAKQVASHFQQFWTTFARANSPNRAAGQSQKAAMWPLFTTDAKQEIVLQPTLATEAMGTYRARHAERCAFWRQVEERIANDVQFAWK